MRREAPTMPRVSAPAVAMGILWCLLVVVVPILLYLGLGLVGGSLIEDPIRATIAIDLVVVTVIGGARMLRPSWFVFAPRSVRRPRGIKTPMAVIGTALLAFLAGQAAGLWLYDQLGSTGFDVSNQARHEAGPMITMTLTLIVAPLAEEMLFRGLIYPLLRRRVAAPAAILVSAVAFSLLHANLVQFAATLPLGLLLAIVYEHSRRLDACIVLHLGFNLTASFVPPSLLHGFADVVTMVLLLAAFTVCVCTLYRRIRDDVAPWDASDGGGGEEPENAG